MTDQKTGSKKSSMNPIVGIGIGCLVILVVLGVVSSLVMRFFAKRIGTSLIQSAIENKTGIKANLNDIENGKMTFTDNKTGETVNIGSNTLPANFPKDFPQYPGSKVVGTLSGGKTGSTGFFVTFNSSDSLDKVVSYYQNKLKANGWTINSSYSADQMTTYSIANSSLEGTVVLSTDSSKKETSIAVSLGSSTDSEESDSDQ